MNQASNEEKFKEQLIEKGFAKDLLDIMTEYELFRLLDNCEAGTRIFQITAPFDICSFDDDLADLVAKLKNQGQSEIITTIPSTEEGEKDTITFVLIFASQIKTSDKLKQKLAKEFKNIEVTPLP